MQRRNEIINCESQKALFTQGFFIDLKSLHQANNQAGIKRIDAEGEKLNDELQAKYKNDKEGEKRLRQKLMGCEADLH